MATKITIKILVNIYLKKVAVTKLWFISIFLENTVELPKEKAANNANKAAFMAVSSVEIFGRLNPNVRK